MENIYSEVSRGFPHGNPGHLRGRLRIFLTVVLLLVVTNVMYAQAAKFTINRENATVSQIIADVERQSDFTFAYSLSALNSIGRVTVKVSDATLDQVMNLCLSGTPYTYAVENNVVVIKQQTQQQPQQPQKVITGRVTRTSDATPIVGVTVMVAGTTTGTATDANGQYRIATRDQNPTLVFTYVGMKKVEERVGNRSAIDVKMAEDVKDVDELTVIAYGTRDKKELISSVSSVKATDIDDMPAASLETLLQGQMAGVSVNNISGSPGGGGSQVRIRGYNSLMDDNVTGYAGVRDGSPLYVIDGVPVSSFTSPVTGTNTLAEIDPATIASVEVLKDAASAALYGSRASNGVILITTKQGQTGKATFTANASYSHSILPKTPKQVIGHGERLHRLQAARSIIQSYYDSNTGTYKVPSSYGDVYGTSGTYDYLWNAGNPMTEWNISKLRPLTDSLNPFYNNASNFWKDSFQPGKILNANISASGGGENVRYMIGAGIYNEEGIMPASEFTRYNIMTNLNATPIKNLKVDSRIYIAYTERVSGGANTFLTSANRVERLTVDPSRTSTLYPSTGIVAEKLLQNINEGAEKNNSLRLRGSLHGAYTFIPGLQLSSMISVDYSLAQRNSFAPASHDPQVGSKSTGSWAGTNVLNTETLLSYNKSFFDAHNVEFLGGYAYNRISDNSISGWGRGGPNDNIHYVGEGWPGIYDSYGTVSNAKQYFSDFSEERMISWIGRVAYNYKKKYLAEFTWRRDGSSTFGEDVRWADFPSVAVGWNFSDENFMRRFWWLSHGKLRASWGSTGQTFGDPYLAHGTWEMGSSFLGHGGLIPSSPLNTRLKWEKSDQYDIGLDVDLFDSRVRFKVDYYYKYSSSILNKVDMPGNFYYHANAFQNVMEISNEGLEIEANFDILRYTAVQWRVKFNLSRNWNRLEKTDTGTDLLRGNTQLLVIGRPIMGFYVLKDKGIVQTDADIPVKWDHNGNAVRLKDNGYVYMPGMRIYEDFNQDGNITSSDMYYAASTLPTVQGGIISELTWNGFDMNVLFTYSLGRHLINQYAYSSMGFNTMELGPLFVDPSSSTFWERPGDGNTDYPTLAASLKPFSYGFQYNETRSDALIEKVNFLRLKQLTIGYKLPKKWSDTIGLSGVRVFFTAENLFLLTNYSGIDPEIIDPYSGYDNFNNYPLARKLTLGLTLTF